MALILTALTSRLQAREDMNELSVRAAAAALMAEEAPADEKEEFLSALSAKGETAAEVAAFASAFRDWAVDPGVGALADEAIDIVGTGGDHSGGFNISTMVVQILASAGVKVMKHGNRGITSKCGSADLFGALGFDVTAPPATQKAALEKLGYCFFLAPSYHPAFKHIMPVRKALAAKGQRTVFNILGPLINPGRPSRILLGSFSETWVPRLAEVLGLLGMKSGLAAHGVIGEGKGIDEITTATRNRVVGIGSRSDIDTWWEAKDFGIAPADFADLQGGDVAENRALVDELIAGRGPKGLEDTIVLNAALALWLCDRAPDARSAIPQARDLLRGGAVAQKIADTRDFFAA